MFIRGCDREDFFNPASSLVLRFLRSHTDDNPRPRDIAAAGQIGSSVVKLGKMAALRGGAKFELNLSRGPMFPKMTGQCARFNLNLTMTEYGGQRAKDLNDT